MVIVNDADVVVVDSHITPATGRELIADIGRITDKPISVVVNTHFHYDHATATRRSRARRSSATSSRA